MPALIVATVGSATANSYVTQAECDTYMDDRIASHASEWVGEADSDEKDRALLQARRELDLLPWRGFRVDDVQALAWPREEVRNPDDPDTDDPSTVNQELTYYDTTIVPDRIKDAQCEYALEILKSGTVDLTSRPGNLQVKRKKIDVLETEFYPLHQRAQGLELYTRIVSIIYPLLDPLKLGGPVITRV